MCYNSICKELNKRKRDTMSYCGIRKMKFITNEEGKYNISCECYDSSIRSYNGSRVWYKSTNLYKNSFNTKAELEYAFFEDVLDGNIHGATGKFACLNWNNRKVNIPLEIQNKLQELNTKYWELSKEVNNIKSQVYKENENLLQPIKEKSYEEFFNTLEKLSPLYKAKSLELEEIRKTKEELRYKSYYEAWQEYLINEKANNKEKSLYIVTLNYLNYPNVYIQNKTSTKTTFSYYISNAKIFNKSITELKEMFLSNPKYSNVRIINVKEYVTGEGKRKHVKSELINNTELESSLTTTL